MSERPSAEKDAPLDPLAMALFGVRDHVRHHNGCADRRGIVGHHYDEAHECALRAIVKRYGDERAAAALLDYARASEENQSQTLTTPQDVAADLREWVGHGFHTSTTPIPPGGSDA